MLSIVWFCRGRPPKRGCLTAPDLGGRVKEYGLAVCAACDAGDAGAAVAGLAELEGMADAV